LTLLVIGRPKLKRCFRIAANPLAPMHCVANRRPEQWRMVARKPSLQAPARNRAGVGGVFAQKPGLRRRNASVP